MSVLTDKTVTKRFFFPRKKDVSEPYYINANGYKLSCIQTISHENGNMMVVFHAANELVEDYLDSFAYEIDKMGLNLLLVEYPGYSLSSGESNLLDLISIVPDVIKNCGAPKEKLIIFGRSLGSVYATEAVAKFPQIKGLILESAISDFYHRFTKRVYAEELDCSEEELKEEILKYFDTEKKLKLFRGSTLIMHAKDDRIIGTEQALLNYEWANEPKSIKLFENGVHKDLQFSNKTEYFQSIDNFVSSLD